MGPDEEWDEILQAAFEGDVWAFKRQREKWWAGENGDFSNQWT